MYLLKNNNINIKKNIFLNDFLANRLKFKSTIL